VRYTSSVIEQSERVAEVSVVAYLAYLRRQDAAPKTIVKYEPQLRFFAGWVGERALGEISAAQIELDYLDRWYANFEARNGRKPARRTVANHIQALSSWFAWLDKVDLLVDGQGCLARNPLPKIDRPKIKARVRPWLEEAEMDALFGAARTLQQAFIARWLAFTGVRIGADVVRCMDVNVERGAITVAVSKTDDGVRQITIWPALKPVLAHWIDDLKRRGLYAPHTPLLCTRNATAVTEQQAHRMLGEMGRRAGLPKKVGPQVLRRTFGSHLLQRGCRIEVVSKQMGHASVATTMAYYAELLDATVAAEVMRALEATRPAVVAPASL
jgi:integrase